MQSGMPRVGAETARPATQAGQVCRDSLNGKIVAHTRCDELSRFVIRGFTIP